MNPNDNLDSLFTPEAFRQTMSGAVAQGRAGMPVAGTAEATQPQDENMGVGDYALDILTAVPKGIVGAAKDVASLAYLPLQAGAGLPEIPDYFGLFDPPKSMAGSIVDTLSGFATGYGAVARGLGLVGRATTLGQRAVAASRAANVAAVQRFGAAGGRAAEVGTEFLRTSTISGITSGLVFDGNEERLSNLLRDDLGFTDPITEYLAADENDSELEGRLKNVIEDFLLGGVAEIGIQAVKATARAGINQLRVHRAGVKAKLAGMDPDEAMAREMRIVSEEQEVSVSRAMNTTLDESRQVLRLIDATGAARENFEFMTRDEAMKWAQENQGLLEAARPGLTPAMAAEKMGGFQTVDKAGKILIGGFKSASLDTAIHEVAHGIRMLIVDPNVANKVLSNSDIGAIADAAGAVRNADGTINWTPEAEEQFVRLFNTYLMNGVTSSKANRRVFSKLTGWVRQYYVNNEGEFAEGTLNPLVKKAFDNLANNGVDGAVNSAGKIDSNAGVLFQDRVAPRVTARQQEVAADPKFKRWFKQSVAQDQGIPQVMYHGTKGEFSEFTRSDTLRFPEYDSNKALTARKGDGLYFFSQRPSTASRFAGEGIGANVMPVFLRIERPFIPSSDEGAAVLKEFVESPAAERFIKDMGIEQAAMDRDMSVAEFLALGDWNSLEHPDLIKHIKDKGYDALSVWEEGFTNWAVFSNKQIKSVFNKGEWSPEDSRILFQSRFDAASALPTRGKATAADFTPKGIKNITKRDDWAILTAENPGNVTRDAAENARYNARLEEDLINGGFEYVKITGKYGKELENSFLVLGIDPAKAQDFGRSYSQEAVLTREGLLYRDGTVNPAKRAKLLKDDAADYYSEVNGTKFALDIDFGKRQPSQLVPAIPTTDTPVLLRSQPPMRDFGGPERVLFQERGAPYAGTRQIIEKASPIWDVEASEALKAFEEAHIGGVADLGDPEAKAAVGLTKDYANAVAPIRKKIKEVLGSKFTLYRAMSKDQLNQWKNGEDVGPMSGTLSEGTAARFTNLAAVSDKDRIIVGIEVTPNDVVMRGSQNEGELVFDANNISFDTVKVLPEDKTRVLFQERGYQMTPGSPGLGTPSGRGGEPRTTINFARFSTEQGSNEQAKEWMDTYIEATAGSEVLSIDQQIARAESAKGELLDALGVQDFGSLEQFMRGPAGAGATLDASKRIMASRQLLADIGGYAANLGRRHKTAGHAEMYDFLRAQQMMKFLGHFVKQEVREAARILGAQRAVFVPDPDFKILPSFEAPTPRPTPEVPAGAMPETPTRMPQEATASGTPLGTPEGAGRLPEASTGPEMAPAGEMPPAGAAVPPAGALPAPAGLDPDVVAKAMAQAINDAGGEAAVRAQMHRTAMAQATGNPLAVAKLSRAQRFGNVLTEYFMNSILSGPTTHVINIAGNSLVSMYLPMERALGASIRGIAGGQGASNSLRMAGEHLRAYRHMFHVFKDSMTFARASFMADRNILDNMTTVEQKGRAISAAGLGMTEGTLAANAVNWLGKALNIPTRVLSSTDEMFKQMNYRAALLTELEVEGLAKFNGDARQASVWADQTMNKMIENGQAYSEKVVLQKAMAKADEAVAAGTIRADERSSYIARFMADTNNWDPELGALSERAMDYSRYATFSTPLVVGEGGRISRVSARIQQVAEESTAIRFIMPFIRTPTRILEFALDRSIPGQPYNLKNAFGELKGKLKHSDRAVRDEAMGRVAFAVMTTYGLFHMIAAGGITGDGPSNPTERQAWLEAGNQPYSVRFGDKWVSYRRLDPFASMMGLVVDTMDSYGRASERQKPQLEAVVNSIIIGLANNFTNKSYLTGVTSILEAIKDPERYGDKLVNQYVSAMVPYSSALRQAKGTVDNDLVVRDVRGMLDAVMNTVPVASRAVEPRRNIFGEPIKRAEGLGPDWMSPITYTNVSDDLILNEFNLVGHSFDAPRENRNGMNLTEVVSSKGQTAYDRWQELHGQVKVGGKGLRQALTQLIKSRQYQMMSPETTDMYESPRVRALRQVVEKYRSAAFTQLMREIPEIRQGVDRDFAVKRALKTGRPVDELMALTNR